MLTRRKFISCCCATSFTFAAGSAGRDAFASAPNGWRPICAASLDTFSPSTKFVSRDPSPALKVALVQVSALIGIKPVVQLIDDSEHPTMQAYISSDEQHGKVGVGIRFLSLVAENNYHEEVLTGLLAHEFAHVMQIQSPCYVTMYPDEGPRSCIAYHSKDGRVESLELMADFIAGWTLARLNKLTTNQFGGFVEELFNKADFQRASLGHHGTPRDRITFMATGFAYGRGEGDLGYNENVLMEKADAVRDFTSVRSAFIASQATVIARRGVR